MASPAARDRAKRLMPGLAVAASYDRSRLLPDLRAGLVLTAVLIPVGIGYAQASGLPAHTGLYATIVPLLAYALFGPSRILVLGPDSALAPILAVTLAALAGGDEARAVALAGLMSIMVGAMLLLGGVLRLGFVTDLLSTPIRIGFLNGLALVVVLSQLPDLLGLEVEAERPFAQVRDLLAGIGGGEMQADAALLGLGTLVVMVVARAAFGLRGSGMVGAVALAVAATVLLGLQAEVPTVGPMPQGLPAPALGGLAWSDVPALLGPAAGVALISFADTAALSHAYAAKRNEAVSGNQEMAGLGLANIASGLLGGFAVSASTSRTPVAEQAGATSQLAGVVGAVLILVFMQLIPGATAYLPEAVLAAVVIVAAAGFVDVAGYARLWRLERTDALLSTAAFLGVFLVGVLQGITLAIGLAFVAFVIRAWRPYRTELGLVRGRRGYHDRHRNPEAERIPGLLILRFDAPLFFANGGLFDQWVRRAVGTARREIAAEGGQPPTTLILAAEPVTDLDTTAAEALVDVDDWLASEGITLVLAELKGPIKDTLSRYGLDDRFPPDRFQPTVGAAVDAVTGRLRDDIDEGPDERTDVAPG
jgi:high affinity sulfate transporter 1